MSRLEEILPLAVKERFRNHDVKRESLLQESFDAMLTTHWKFDLEPYRYWSGDWTFLLSQTSKQEFLHYNPETKEFMPKKPKPVIKIIIYSATVYRIP